MTQASESHFTEEQLTAYAMGEQSPDIAAHLVGCASCSKLVEQIGRLKKEIVELPDEEVPEPARRRILTTVHGHSSHRAHRNSHASLLGWVRSPTVLIVGTMLLLFLLYFAYVTFG